MHPLHIFLFSLQVWCMAEWHIPSCRLFLRYVVFVTVTTTWKQVTSGGISPTEKGANSHCVATFQQPVVDNTCPARVGFGRNQILAKRNNVISNGRGVTGTHITGSILDTRQAAAWQRHCLVL